MPKKQREGKRVNIWIPGKQMETAVQIENLSKFFQMCLDQAPDIMAFAMLHDIDPKKYEIPSKQLVDVVDDFNEAYPLDELTLKRQNKWPKPSPKKHEIW